MLQKDKLEALCRELQRQNNSIKEECLSRTRIEEERRKAVADKFQASISDIQEQLNAYQTRNTELRNENVLQTKELEAKLADAKRHKTECLLDQEKARADHQLARTNEETKLMSDRMNMHLQMEEQLKKQVNDYHYDYFGTLRVI
ncbi:unnamed protein product [Protopolystoma xenopodis]|uniref:Uncharacterized protein n=1 Tax=Protopolystoma xenopodis TaxID=117903 RepID=A0A3S5AP59_9PLAT|nr:unnamed protein product [Protopolystoma xenopodis]